MTMTSISPLTEASAGQIDQALSASIDAVAQIVLGKRQQISMALCCLLARGHLLIEDLPGMGKTTLSHTLGQVLGLEHQRIQFTSDMLPSDVIGASIYDKNSGEFRFIKGPVFAQLLLADEVNRTTPKTQSALLEAMEERQVTVDGVAYALPEPFFVIATQNPVSQSGTYPLPESQLDRFLMRIELGYPDEKAEREMLLKGSGRQQIAQLESCIGLQSLIALQARVDKVRASEVLLDYLQRLVNYSRTASDFAYGLSPRGTLALLQAAKSWALIEGRNHVIPEDLQTVLPAVAAHRLESSTSGQNSGKALVAQMLDTVAVI